MKIRTRVAIAVTAALISAFVAVPAFAVEMEPISDELSAFSSAGSPLDVVAITVTGVVLLLLLLALSGIVSRRFTK